MDRRDSGHEVLESGGDIYTVDSIKCDAENFLRSSDNRLCSTAWGFRKQCVVSVSRSTKAWAARGYRERRVALVDVGAVMSLVVVKTT